MQKSSIHVSIARQELELRRGSEVIRRYPVSTSRFGVGTEPGSRKTPLGEFRISDKIGAGMPVNTIFVGRVPLGADDPLPDTEDHITSRILWLDGVEPQNANTRARYIYIHGTRWEEKIGQADSHGCIRMRNADVIELFGLVEVGTPVKISQ
ncbi:MAG: L,D-transpeptidase [Verrucomicrobia bacterium]|nr:L,D-transpeptidase [Verrucomicrobiota bacterium]